MAGEIILGYDGQDGSKTALRTATAIAAAFKRPLVVVFGYMPVQMGGDTGDLARAVKEIGERMTTEAVELVHETDPSVEVQVEMVDDRPAESILRAADEHEALAIVVGSAGRGPVAGALLGSVTYQVVHRSTRPVVVVPTPVD
jgi:nucleotide-binding universal stress UspA family protein